MKKKAQYDHLFEKTYRFEDKNHPTDRSFSVISQDFTGFLPWRSRLDGGGRFAGRFQANLVTGGQGTSRSRRDSLQRFSLFVAKMLIIESQI